MFLSIVIPTYNRNDLLRKCLHLIEKAINSEKSFSCEVIVCDDSTNNTAKLMVEDDFSWATWKEGPKKGPAANRNGGARDAKGDWIIFLDDDCLPSENFVAAYYRAIKHFKAVKVFEGRTIGDRKKRSFLDESPINETGGLLWSCNFCIQKQFFIESLHGFDDNFPYAAMEDIELHYRIEKLNEQIIFVEDALVIHPWRYQKNLLKLTRSRFDSWRYFMDKHPEKFKVSDFFSLKAFAGFAYRELLLNGIKYRGRGIYLYFLAYLKRINLQYKYSIEKGK